METGYEYNNVQYKVAVDTLKATFYDIISQHQKQSKSMEETINVSEGQEQDFLTKIFNLQQAEFNEMLGLVDSVIGTIQVMDSCSQFVANVDMNQQELRDGVVIEDSNLNLVEQQQEPLVNSLMAQQVGVDDVSVSDGNNVDVPAQMNHFEPNNIVVEKNNGVNDINNNDENTVVAETVPANPVAGDAAAPVMDVGNIKLNFDAPNVPTIVGDMVEENKDVPVISAEKSPVIEQSSSNVDMVNSVDAQSSVTDQSSSDVGMVNGVAEQNPVIADNNVLDAQNSDGVLQESNGENDEVSSVSQDVNISQILSPIDDVLPANVGDTSVKESEVESTVDGSETSTQKEEKTQQLDDDVENNDIVVTVGIIQFVRVSSGAVKAILVTPRQFGNLLNSKGAQKFLFEEWANSNEEQEKVENTQANRGIVQQQEAIEKMLNQANLLYKEGKTEEAQKMYDKISEMNNQLRLQSQVGAGVPFVKK